MRDGLRHAVHESLDFTPKGNRAERVQTVNVGRYLRALRLFKRLSALRHVLDIDTA
jgi:hypothetical protein